jgi:hypothetical protein
MLPQYLAHPINLDKFTFKAYLVVKFDFSNNTIYIKVGRRASKYLYVYYWWNVP